MPRQFSALPYCKLDRIIITKSKATNIKLIWRKTRTTV